MKITQISKFVVATLLIAVAAPALLQSASAATFTFQSSPLTNLDPAGATINGGFTTFPTKAGMYIQQCNAPIGNARPSVCSDTIQLWVTSAGGRGTTSPTGPIAITVASSISGKGTTVDCTKESCGLFFRLDHTAPTDLSEDTFMPITFRAGAASTPALATDEITVTLNGKVLTRNVPINLGYRELAKIKATSKSGLPVELSSLTNDCTYSNGIFTALKGAGQCALAHSTAGNSQYAPSKANYPFILVPGDQSLKVSRKLRVKRMLALPAMTNFGEKITYQVQSKNCVLVGRSLRATKTGTCTVSATAAAKEGMWKALDQTINVAIVK